MYPITLTSDFGLKSHYAASVKGVVLSQLGQVNIIDISHQVPAFNLHKASYVFKNAYLNFPKNSFHFIFNDLHTTKSKKILYVYENSHHILCPDNGFLTLLFGEKPIRIYSLIDEIEPFNYIQVATQYCQVANAIINGVNPYLEAVSIDKLHVRKPSYPYEENGVVETQIIHIDTFGNVILNITKQQFEEYRKGRKFKILFMRDDEISKLQNHYNDVPVNEVLCLFNSNNYLEIAINRGNAANAFGFEDADDRSLFYTKIKIFFE
ncbi:MAG TPA: SAM-dependent chlorinase/fluorinase [Chitinophagaceae bacterium]|nr:SAM-dependent chlorinase/fluorinase [Chitinophagaceae bacterium]